MDPTALGRYLRESREAKELTLEDAVRALRIRRDILESFEQGDFNIMDSTVRIRGMLRNYAQFLGLEEDRVLQYYESANSRSRKRRLGRREQHVEPIAPRKITDTQPTLPVVNGNATASGRTALQRIANFMGIIAMILLSIAAIVVIVFVTRNLLGMDEPTTTIADAPTVIPGSLSATPTNTPTITPRATILTDTPAPAIGVTGVQVDVEIEQRSWVSIKVDDREQFSGFLEPGYTSSFTGNQQVTFRAANAAALNIIYNGIQQETFGARGQEVEIAFTTTGIDIIQSDVVPVLASDTPTQAVNVPPVTQSAQSTAASVVNQSTPIPTQILPSPTPLFGASQSSDDTETEPSSAESAPIAQSPVTDNPTQQSNPEPVTASTEIESSATPTIAPTEEASQSNLPLRATPSNPTPTKTG